MNHSIYSADRATHLKVVISVLLAGIAIVAITLTAGLTHPEIDVQKATAQDCLRSPFKPCSSRDRTT
ncbi:hypothetical protein AB7M69_011251 [Bradyrhizobium japonicum]